MSSQLIPFEFEGHNVRIETRHDGEILLVAADVCRVLGVANVSDAISRLDDDEKGIVKSYTPGGVQDLLAVTESGFYTLTIRSNKPQAKPFRRWVTHEVLPQIRKTGKYEITAIPAPNLSLPSPEQIALQTIRDWKAIAEELGAPEYLALIEASKKIEGIGVNITPLLNASPQMITHDGTDLWLEPTELGKRHNMTGVQLNKLLESMGLQAKIKAEWAPTDLAEGLYVWHQWKSTHSTKSGRNLKWHVSRVEQLIDNFFEANRSGDDDFAH